MVNIYIPPLRMRTADILPLANFFLKKYSGELSKPIRGFDSKTIDLFHKYDWPGNIRELKNALERAVLMTEEEEIAPTDLALTGFGGDKEQRPVFSIQIPPEGVDLEMIEKELVVEALKKVNWIQKDAARLLRISRRVMNYKIQKYNITSPTWVKNK